ncbi:hypothetical protein DNTS_003305 [Danionella cerebrum]|uniref:One cut domain family member n=1 Tax=Danionella cerebrum TaxID=2873325 RepID=A0A553MVM6_9TELE|nr:hypothetical protein DNTS_003305 [Danionella translucida]
MERLGVSWRGVTRSGWGFEGPPLLELRLSIGSIEQILSLRMNEAEKVVSPRSGTFMCSGSATSANLYLDLPSTQFLLTNEAQNQAINSYVSCGVRDQEKESDRIHFKLWSPGTTHATRPIEDTTTPPQVIMKHLTDHRQQEVCHLQQNVFRLEQEVRRLKRLLQEVQERTANHIALLQQQLANNTQDIERLEVRLRDYERMGSELRRLRAPSQSPEDLHEAPELRPPLKGVRCTSTELRGERRSVGVHPSLIKQEEVEEELGRCSAVVIKSEDGGLISDPEGVSEDPDSSRASQQFNSSSILETNHFLFEEQHFPSSQGTQSQDGLKDLGDKETRIQNLLHQHSLAVVHHGTPFSTQPSTQSPEDFVQGIIRKVKSELDEDSWPPVTQTSHLEMKRQLWRSREREEEQMEGREFTSEENVELDTLSITLRVKETLSQHNIGQRVFGEQVLGLTQSSVSELLSRPKPWRKLSHKSKENFLRMHRWLRDPHSVHQLRIKKKMDYRARLQRDSEQILHSSPQWRRDLVWGDALRRPRLVLSDRAKAALLVAFEMEPYPSPASIQRLSEELGLMSSTVSNWFYNHRSRMRRDRLSEPVAPRRTPVSAGLGTVPVEQVSVLVVQSLKREEEDVELNSCRAASS